MESPSPGTPPKTSPLPSHLLQLTLFSATSISRFQSLYSDFSRQRSSNPTSYQANVQWWRRAFEALALSGEQSSTSDSNRFTLNANRELLDRLRIEKVGKPIGLATVISELCQSGQLIPEQTFSSSTKSIYDAGGLSYRLASLLIGKPLWWALEQSGVVGEDSYASSAKSMFSSSSSSEAWFGCYVIVSLLEQAAETVLQLHMDSSHDALYSLEEFRTEFSSVVGKTRVTNSLRDDEVGLLTKFMERDKGKVISDGSAIKFIDPVGSSEANSISAIDHGVLELRIAVSSLHKQVDSLQTKCEECTQKAKDALRRTQKTVAQSHLRTKKHLEGLLTKRLGALDNLQATLISVEGARGDVEIMKTYQSSTATLRSILSHPLLHSKTIDETMDALADVNAEAKEIDEVIRDAGSISTGAVDISSDDDIENELAALIAEQTSPETVKDEAQKDAPLPQMPSVPDTLVGKPENEDKRDAVSTA